MALHLELGAAGEQLACQWLLANGYTILHRNWRHGRDELDIVAREGGELVVVEVKTRATGRHGEPEDAVSPAKRRKLMRAAAAYVEHVRPSHRYPLRHHQRGDGAGFAQRGLPHPGSLLPHPTRWNDRGMKDGPRAVDQAAGPRRKDDDRPPRRAGSDERSTGGAKRSYGGKKPFRKSPARGPDDRPERSYSRGPRRKDDRKPFRKSAPRSPDDRSERSSTRGPRRDDSRKPFRKSPVRGRDDRSERPYSRGPRREDGERRPYRSGPPREERREPQLRESKLKSTDKWNDKPGQYRERPAGAGGRKRFDGPGERPPFGKDDRSRERSRDDRGRPPRSFDRSDDRPRHGRDERPPFRRKGKAPAKKQADLPEEGLVRLNRYLAHSGVGSRREADESILAGVVTVNGSVVTELGTKVSPTDVVQYGGHRVRMERKRYVLLNKPKDTITTTDDPQDRRTVISLVAEACTEKIFPVGRLDRNTTGLLLLTNDGELANHLTHPRYGIDKIYHVTLDRNVSVEDLHRLTEGVQLDDGPAHADEVSHVGESKREVGVKLHTGRNRVVRRMFETLGYEVVKLDRVLFAGLTKKDLGRGQWRHLTEQEVVLLKRIK